MRRKRKLVMLALSMLLMLAFGCAQKSVVRENRVEPQGEAALAPTSEAKVPPAAAAENKLAEPAAARDAAMEKAAAEKLAMERAATDKLTMEKAAAEKAAAEKLAREKVTPANAQAEKEAIKKAAEKELYEPGDIKFNFDKFDLGDEAREILKKHAAWLAKNRDVKITVEGHCDERGTAEYNLALGERRANAAAKFLMNMGIEGKRLQTISYGEETPLYPEHNEAAWAKNRRAHFVPAGKQY